MHSSTGTDIDAFIEANRDTWARLEELVRRAGSSATRLSANEVDELVQLHLRVSSQLSTTRTHLADPDLAAHLSRLVARSSAVVHGTRPRTLATLLRGITEVFPAAVWHARTAILISTLVFVASFAAMTVWLAVSPEAVAAMGPEEFRQSYLEEDFEAYYSAEPATAFAARVFTNNAAVGALAFGSGILWGIPTLYVLLLNGINVGLAAGLFHAADDAAHFWGLILPHGLLELTAVFIAGGAGLKLGWSAIQPGERTRRESLAEEGRRSVSIVLGLVLVFLVAGLLEGYITPQPWSAPLRVGIGAAVWAAVTGWLILAGRSAAKRGLTGTLGEVATPRSSPAAHQPPRSLTSR